MPNIVSRAIDAVKRGPWVRWLHSLDDEALQEVHNNFTKWRDNPEGDYSLDYDELNNKIAVIESVMATRV